MIGRMEMKWIVLQAQAAMKTMSAEVREERRDRRENPLLLCPVSRRRFRAKMRRQAAINNKRRAQETQKDRT